MSLKDADEEQVHIVIELKDMGKGKMPAEKRSFSKNARLLLCAKEEIVNNFKSKIFITKILEPTPEQKVFATPKQKRNEMN